MAVRKRRWTTSKGDHREAWIVDYADASGARCQETFKLKKEADARHAEVSISRSNGCLVAPSKTITVQKAGENWLTQAEADNLEKGTRLQYRQHLNLHILPLLGKIKLSQLSTPMLLQFERSLASRGCSRSMIGKVRTSLGSIIALALDQGQVARNVVRERGRLKRGQFAEGRSRRKLEIGADIPTPREVAKIYGTPNRAGGRCWPRQL